MKQTILAIAAIILSPFALFAQGAPPSKNPVSDAVRSLVERESKNLVAAADEMPADKYSFHPTPDQMTFGHLVVHMAGSNNFLCSKISGTPAPTGEKLSDTDPKDKLLGALKASFQYCTEALAKVDDSNLGEELTLFGGRTMTRAAAMIALTNDFADHYSMAATYLRLNSLLPPTAQKKN
ncbi:MAG TPA: DinB family protein [Candidatus Acidoferrum sp.]|nr:DinB family protein [Candidatus Acidoferrum sp.]